MGRGPDGEPDGSYPWRLRTIPVAAVSNPTADLVIAAGSEIEPAVLQHEVDGLEKAGYKITERLYIDGQATILEEHHKQAEADFGLTAKLGSTGKGIGAARAARLMREAELARSYYDAKEYHVIKTDAYLRKTLNDGGHVVIEGTQGYGLGLHAGHYPQCTSSDCRAVDFCAMAGLSPVSSWVRDFKVWAVMRTFPIRVAGNSGPLMGETSWSELGLEPELTTVTKKVRRVGQFDYDLAAAAIEANGGPAVVDIALTMFDYVFPEYKGRHGWLYFDDLNDKAKRYIEDVETASGALVKLLGTGPDTVLQVQ
jgi:adenylosuccinate synthase